MKVDPAVVKIFAENVRAEVISRPALSHLDQAMVQKIADKVKVFQGMPADVLSRTLAMADHMPFAAGEVVFKEGDIGSAFHVLIAGEVVVEKIRSGHAVELARLTAGECFGEMALVGNHLRSATVTALRSAITMRFDRERVDTYPECAHIIYRNIARVLSARLDMSSELLADMTLRHETTRPADLR
jgi:CRP-like cAMP-binding protein